MDDHHTDHDGNENSSVHRLFAMADRARMCVDQLLEDFNLRQVKLFDLSASRRIFLFILTRSLKTYASILVLCRHGYGQDAAVLLRGFLENLITAEYILHNPAQADDLAARFVAYKWIVFKRSLSEQERTLQRSSPREQSSFEEYKALVLRRVEEFKRRFHVLSDRALITWSGKTVRDMARHVSPQLAVEYDRTFRICSRFSHPTILGDHEYMLRDTNDLIFSTVPSLIGVEVDLKLSIQYLLEFAALIGTELCVTDGTYLAGLKEELSSLEQIDVNLHGYSPTSPSSEPAGTIPLRECAVVFRVPGEFPAFH